MKKIIKIFVPGVNKSFYFYDDQIITHSIDMPDNLDDNFDNLLGCQGGYLRFSPYRIFSYLLKYDGILGEALVALQSYIQADGSPAYLLLYPNYGAFGDADSAFTVQMARESVSRSLFGELERGNKEVFFVEVNPDGASLEWDGENDRLHVKNPFTLEEMQGVRAIWFQPSHLPAPQGLINGVLDLQSMSAYVPETPLIDNFNYNVFVDGVNRLTINGISLDGYTWGMTGNIPGLVFNAETRTLEGVPTAAGEYDIYIYTIKGDDPIINRKFTVVVSSERVDTNFNGTLNGMSFITPRLGPVFQWPSEGKGRIHIPSDNCYDLWSENHAPYIRFNNSWHVNPYDGVLKATDFETMCRMSTDRSLSSYHAGLGIRFQGESSTNAFIWGAFGNTGELVAQRTGEGPAFSIPYYKDTVDLKIKKEGLVYICFYKEPTSDTWTQAGSYYYGGEVCGPMVIGRTMENRALDIDVDFMYCTLETDGIPMLQQNHFELLTGQAISHQIAASDGFGVNTFFVNAGQVPAGLSISKYGELSGTPLESGKSSIFIGVMDESSSIFATQKITFDIRDVESSTIIPTVLPAMYKGESVQIVFDLLACSTSVEKTIFYRTDDAKYIVTDSGKKIKITL